MMIEIDKDSIKLILKSIDNDTKSLNDEQKIDLEILIDCLRDIAKNGDNDTTYGLSY